MQVPLYQYYAEQSDGLRYFYSTSSSISDGWKMRGILCCVFNKPINENAGWGNSSEAEWYLRQTSPIYQYHHDQSATYGGWRYMFSSRKDITGGWELDCEAFRAFKNGYPQWDHNAIKINRYHKVQQDGWRSCYIPEGQNPGEMWILDQFDYFYARPATYQKDF